MAGEPRRLDVSLLNAVRYDAAAVKREVRDGLLPPDRALWDPRARSLRVVQLLAAQWKWGEYEARRFARAVGVRADVRLRELSDAEIDRLEFALYLRRTLPRRRWYPSRDYRALIDLIRA